MSMGPGNQQYDVFISHAVEDKIPIANELESRLVQAGISVWYSSRNLRVGQSIENTIYDGIANSKVGIVILSKNYLTKDWTMQEYHELQSKQREGKKVVLPVLYGITPQELAAKSIYMADRYSVNFEKGMDHVVQSLLAEINHVKKNNQQVRASSKRKFLVGGSITIIMLSLLGYFGFHSSTTTTSTEQTSAALDPVALVQQRIDQFQKSIDDKLQLQLKDSQVKASMQKDIVELFETFTNAKSYYRNAYSFTTDNVEVQSRKNVNATLNLEVEDLKPINNYNFTTPTIYLLSDKQVDNQRQVQYVLVNTKPISFQVNKLHADSSLYKVSYTDNLRAIYVTLKFPNSTKDTKRHTMDIVGLLPTETFNFTNTGGVWSYTVNSSGN